MKKRLFIKGLTAILASVMILSSPMSMMSIAAAETAQSSAAVLEAENAEAQAAEEAAKAAAEAQAAEEAAKAAAEAQAAEEAAKAAAEAQAAEEAAKAAAEAKAAEEAAEAKAAEAKAAEEAAEAKAAEAKAAEEAAKAGAEAKAAEEPAKAAAEETSKGTKTSETEKGGEKTEAAKTAETGSKTEKADSKTAETGTKTAEVKPAEAGAENTAEAKHAEAKDTQADSEEETKTAEAGKEAETAKAAEASKEAEAGKAADASKEAEAAKEAEAGKAADASKETEAKAADASKEAEAAKTAGDEKLAVAVGDLTIAPLALLAIPDFDNTTSVEDGEYAADEFDYSFEGGTGKAKLTCVKVVVSGGRATGYFTASSTSMTHVYYGGHTPGQDDDKTFYDPDTDKCGKNVVPIINKEVSFPVKLGTTVELACRTVAMTTPHWVQYTYKINIHEEEEKIDSLAVNNTVESLTVKEASLGTKAKSGKQTLRLMAGDTTFTRLYLGTAALAAENASDALSIGGDGMFTVNVTGKCGSAIPVSFYHAKDKIWHDAEMTVDADAKTLTLTEGKKADYAKVEAAKKKVPSDLSSYKEARVKTLNDAIAAVREGLYASQQDQVDAWAEAIEKAVAALEKEKLTITVKAIDEETGKEIKGAVITVTDGAGKTVKADKAGVYSLEDGTYTIKATAKNYEDAVKEKYTPKVEETIELKLVPMEIIPEGTTIFKEDEKDPKKTNLFNTTGMFKVIKGTLVKKKDKTTLTVILSGQGYHYLFKGTYEEALKNGLNKKNWIKGTKNKDGKWEFVIPLKETETFIPIVAISDTHLQKVEKGEEELGSAIFARQIVLDLKENTLTAGDYDEIADITVISRTDKFKADEKGKMEIIGGPNSNNYACKPQITMLDGRYSKAFIGTAANAAKSGAKTISKKNGAFLFELTNYFGENGRVRMFEDGKPVAVAFYDTEKKEWTDYKLTIDKAGRTVTIEALKEDEAPPEEPKQNEDEEKTYQDAANKGTSSVDSSTTLADGTYSPKNFRFSGGTGKVVITCSKIEVRGGQAYATITFQKPGGGAASVDSLRANGGTYSGFNTFTIPVSLNTNNTVIARTTAMSQPHWIEYTIYVGLDEPGKETTGTDVAEKSTDLDEEAPDIIGLTADGETEVTYSDLVKIFNYKDGYYLIEIDAVRDTARDSKEYRTIMALEAMKEETETAGSDADGGNADQAAAADGAEGADAAQNEDGGENGTAAEADEEGGSAAAVSISEKIAALYKNEIIKYLVIPAGKEVPAGLDKEVIIIKQPADKTYVSSAVAVKNLAALSVIGNVTTIGLEEADVEDESVLAGMKKESTEDGSIAYAGPYNKWDLRTMILKKTNFVIESSEILPRDEKTIDEDMENLVRLGERSAQMEMAMFIDRSADEENDLAKAEWYKVYGIIFGAQDKAESLYKDVVAKAAQSDKDAAEKRLKDRADEKAKMIAAAKAEAEKQAGA